ncbi:MAG: glycosyltransferase [Flavobacterium sp.]|nr:MAG: glycosyltransferase [Flavobacterium sp.]
MKIKHLNNFSRNSKTTKPNFKEKIMLPPNKPIRVMHIISGDLWAGAEVQAYTLLKYLQPDVSLHVVILNDGELAKRLRALQIQVTILPESTLGSLTIFRKLVKLILHFRPHVIHTHRQKENILGNLANIVASITMEIKAKSVRTTHGAPESVPRGKQKIQVALDQFIGNKFQQAIIAVSDELAEKLMSLFQKNKIHVIHNGVDVEELIRSSHKNTFQQYGHEGMHIGIVGRLEAVKRIDIFIDMAELLLSNPSSQRQFMFHIIGDGRLRKEMENNVKQRGLSEKIFFHGHRNDIGSCIHSLDIIIMCSDHEGTPMTALEALALGTPLIAHDTGGLKCVLEQYPSLLVKDHTPSGYADRVKDFLSKEPISVQLNERYGATLNKNQVLALYEKLIN